MTPRRYTESEYPLIKGWWDARQFPAIPPHFLPKTGFIVENHAFGFLYATDSAMCWLEWLCTNPASDKMDRDKALNLLIETLSSEAKRLGFSVVFTSSNNPKLIGRLEASEFVVSDKDTTQLLRVL